MPYSKIVKTTSFCVVLASMAYGAKHFLNTDSSARFMYTEATEEKMTSHTIQPIELPANIDMRKARIGRQLFSDTRLSKSNSISCHSCHDLQSGGDNGKQFATGARGLQGDTNSPTVFNSAYNFKQFWNGRAEDLSAQVSGPIHNPIEMDSNWPQIVKILNQDKNIVSQFALVFDQPISAQNIIESIVEFERALVTLNAPFDLYLRGDLKALNTQQIRGYQKFEMYGCVACHQGQNIGGNMFQTMGVAHNYFEERGGSFASDAGRFAVTKLEQDRHVFKVPSLRNVELTAPCFHDGSEMSLENAIRKMARYQLGRKLDEDDVADISSFLKSLTGQKPAILNAEDAYAKK